MMAEVASIDSTAMEGRHLKLFRCFANLHIRIQNGPKLHLLSLTFLRGEAVFRFRSPVSASAVILLLSKTRTTARSV